MTFEKHLCQVSIAASLRKSWRMFHDRSVFGRCFQGFILPVGSFGVLFCSLVLGCRYLKLLNLAVSGARFLTGVCLSVTLLIINPCQSFVYFIRSGVKRCTLLMVLYLDHMCQCGFTRYSGHTSVHLCTASLQNLALQHDFYSPLSVPVE